VVARQRPIAPRRRLPHTGEESARTPATNRCRGRFSPWPSLTEGETLMLKAIFTAAFVAMACAPAYAQDAETKGKKWCTDAHMKQMDASIAKMTDAAMQKEAKSHLAASKSAMQAKDTAGCVSHMEQAHKAMGM